MTRLVSIVIVLFVSANLLAQDFTRLAAEAYANKDYVKAAELVDKAIETDEKENAYTWHIRGFIYKNIYKVIDEKERHSEARPTAITSFVASMELDIAGKYKKNNEQSIKYLATQYYNDCVVLLDTVNYEESILFYDRFKESILLIEPTIDFKANDIEYLSALAGMYNMKYKADKVANSEYLEKVFETYEEIIKIDSLDWVGNYNTAIAYYNIGVDIIKELDPSLSIPEIIGWQDSTSRLFLKALPFMLTAYELDKNKVEIPIGLSGIYYNIGNDSLSIYYKNIADKLTENARLKEEEINEYYEELPAIMGVWIRKKKLDSTIENEVISKTNEVIMAAKQGGAVVHFTDKFRLEQDLRNRVLEMIK